MNKTEKWIYVLLTVIAVFLMIDRFLPVCAVAMGVMYGMLLSRELKLRLPRLMTPLVIVAFMTVITLGLSLFPAFSQLVNISASVKELMRVAVYFMVMQTMTMIELDLHVHKTVWKTMTIITVLIVFLQYTKIIDMNGMLKSFYGDSKQFFSAEYRNLSKFRGGSVFVNPNVFACFLSAMLANYLFTLRVTEESRSAKAVMFTLFMTGLVLTGSRTGMILAMLLILYHIYSTSQLESSVLIKNTLLVVAAVAVVIFLLRVVFSVELLASLGLRMFQIEAGMENSLSIKLGILGKLLKNMNIANVVAGYGVYNYSQSIEYMVDFDLGYFITYYGMIGLGTYLLLVYGIYKWGNRALAGRRMLNAMLLLIVLVFGLTAGVYFNLRMFTICLLVFMPALTDMKAQQQLA